MEMKSNDHGHVSLTFNDRTITLSYLFFMDKFYIVTKKDSQLAKELKGGKVAEATLKITKSNNEATVGYEAVVIGEFLDSDSRAEHTHDHLVMVKNNHFPEWSSDLTAIKFAIKN